MTEIMNQCETELDEVAMVATEGGPLLPHAASEELGMQLPPAALQSEGDIGNVSEQDQRYRLELVKQLRSLPPEALPNLRHFQTQVGCFNRCSFCSQGAGTVVWSMTRSALANLISALKTVGLELALRDGAISGNPLTSAGIFHPNYTMPTGGLIGAQRRDRPGVIYCYLDNDPAMYPHLDDLIQWLNEDLGVKVRIATVGYSRRNEFVQKMHTKISESLMSGVSGFRLSFSPYTFGWTSSAERGGSVSREDFERDTAALLSTYQQEFLSGKRGRKGACVELRFKPLVVATEVYANILNGRQVIQCGSYLVVQTEAVPLGFSALSNPTSHCMNLTGPGCNCTIVQANPRDIQAYGQSILDFILGETRQQPDCNMKIRGGKMHRLQNDDGEYFSVDAERKEEGVFSKYFYPKTALRPGSGMIDGERYHLNALLKAGKTGDNETWEHADMLLRGLEEQADTLNPFDERAANYIRQEVITIVASYIRALKYAEFPSHAYFDRNLTVDTGHICNLGRAYSEYKAIASRPDLPLTPNHERAYGLTGELADEGVAWRLAVSPASTAGLAKNVIGHRNYHQLFPSILVEELDLSLTATETGQSKGRFFLQSQTAIRLSLEEPEGQGMFPGSTARTAGTRAITTELHQIDLN